MSKESTNKVHIQKARLMELLQVLKRGNAKIQVDIDIYGREKPTIYGQGKDCDYTLIDLLKVVWTDDREDGLYASPAVIYDYFKDFELDMSSRAFAFLPSKGSVDPIVMNIKAQFRESPNADNNLRKQELFFRGLLPQSSNVLVAFPRLRQNITNRLERFISELKLKEDSFPYRELREQTSLRSYRYKTIEKQIFEFIKQSDEGTLNLIRDNILAVMTAQVNHLRQQEEIGVYMEVPKEEKILTDKLTYRELSDPESISFTDEDTQRLQRVGFQDAFLDKPSWFDDLRLKKLAFWQQNLSALDISAWPKYFFEHFLVSYIELNAVCEELLNIRKNIFNDIGFDISYSSDGIVPKWNYKTYTLEELSGILSNYIYESNAFVRKIRPDGFILQKPLYILKKPLRDDHVKSDTTYYSRIERLLWKYLLIHLCDCCEMNQDWIEKHHDPISKL